MLVLVVAVLCALLAACAAPLPSSTPLLTPTVVASPSPVTNPLATPAPSDTAGPSLNYADAVAFWDGERGIVGLSRQRADGSLSGRLLATGDGGRTWRTSPSTPDGVVQVALAASMDAWALTGCGPNTGCEARLYRSTDGGESWTSAPTDLSWISFLDALDGWGVAGSAPSTDPGLPALRQTHDGGATWATMPTPCAGSTVGPLRTLSARSATAGLAVCALTAGAGGELDAVLATTDGGAHWTVRASTGDASGSKPVGRLQSGGYITGIVDAVDGTAWISGGRMVPLATRDGGTTWRPLALGDGAANLVYAAWPLDSSRGFAVMWAPDRRATLLEATTDGGRAWIERSDWSVTGTDEGAPASSSSVP
jgi:photosystem II stability/assembly factor-like uncharacterized protein